MTYAGLPPLSVLKAATINGATALGIETIALDLSSRVKLADLVVVRGNPLEDIKVARDIRIVVKEGSRSRSPSIAPICKRENRPHGPG